MFFGCTKLDETLYDRLSANTFYKTDAQVLTGLTNVYYKLMLVENWWWPWQLEECTTDHGMTPTRNNGAWYDGNVFQELQKHTWDASHNRTTVTYKYLYSAIASANSFLDILNGISINNKDVIIAEVRAVRAWEYLHLVDLFGNVPIVTVAKLDQKNLPTNSTRKEVFDFIEGELKDAIKLLPSLAGMSDRQSYYPRVAKETAQAMLARLYLNAEVYSGTARWQDCLDVCNEIINSRVYSLTPSISDNFVPLNQNSPEIIFAISQDNLTIGASGGDDSNQGGNWTDQLCLRPQLRYKYGLSFDAWGGPSVLIEHYNIYDDDDYRKSLILSGLQTSPGGDSLTFLIPIKSITSALENEGLVCVKYVPDPLATPAMTGRGLGRNDIVLLRYAEILMSKAEVLYRLGDIGGATDLINEVRARNFVTPKPFANITLDNILQERSREFLWEGTYRTDLVRFGKFITERTQWKNYDDDATRNIFPIPQTEIQANPNLVQNPGY
jgi:SusD family.